jgi:hypothetical protein
MPACQPEAVEGKASSHYRGEGTNLSGGGDLCPQRKRRRGDQRRREPASAAPDAERAPKADVAHEKQGDATSELARDPDIQRVVRGADGRLEPSRDRHDTEQEPVVPVAERDEREIVPSSRRRFGHCSLDLALVDEVRPPERRGERERKQGDEHEVGVELQRRRADPDHHDRLAERDDHNEPVALYEMRRRDEEALDGRQPRRYHPKEESG